MIPKPELLNTELSKPELSKPEIPDPTKTETTETTETTDKTIIDTSGKATFGKATFGKEEPPGKEPGKGIKKPQILKNPKSNLVIKLGDQGRQTLYYEPNTESKSKTNELKMHK